MFEEFGHFFKESTNVNGDEFDYIKQNFDIVKSFCESEHLGDSFNAFEMNFHNQENSEQNKRIFQTMLSIITKMKNAKDYNTYIEIRRKFEQIFSSVYPDINKRCFGIKELNNTKILVVFLEREGKTISFNKSDRLFHTSSIKGMTHLKPAFKSERDGILYPSNRIYFCLNAPIQPSGVLWDKKGAVYEYIPSDTNITLYRDAEFSGDRRACFLKTDTPLPVKDVTNDILQNYDIMRNKYNKLR